VGVELFATKRIGIDHGRRDFDREDRGGPISSSVGPVIGRTPKSSHKKYFRTHAHTKKEETKTIQPSAITERCFFIPIVVRQQTTTTMSGSDTESIIHTSESDADPFEHGSGNRCQNENLAHKTKRFQAMQSGKPSILAVYPFLLAEEEDKAEVYHALSASDTVEHPVPPSCLPGGIAEKETHGEVSAKLKKLEALRQRYPVWSVPNRRFVVLCLRAARIRIPKELLKSLPDTYPVHYYFHAGPCFDKKQEYDAFMERVDQEFKARTGHEFRILEEVMWKTLEEMAPPTAAVPAKQRPRKGTPKAQPMDEVRATYRPGTVGEETIVSVLPEVVSQQALNDLGRSLMASGIAVHPIRSAAVPEEMARSTTERQHELGETLSSWSKAAGEVIAECASAAGKPRPQGLKARSTKNQNNLYRFIGPGFRTREEYDAFHHRVCINYEEATGKSYEETAENALWRMYKKTHKKFKADKKAADDRRRNNQQLPTKRRQKKDAPPPRGPKPSRPSTAAAAVSAKRGRQPASTAKRPAKIAARRPRAASADGALIVPGSRETIPRSKRICSSPLARSRTGGTEVPSPSTNCRAKRMQPRGATANGPFNGRARNDEGGDRGSSSIKRPLAKRSDGEIDSDTESIFHGVLSRLKDDARAARGRGAGR
jgi:hypothetical protein